MLFDYALPREKGLGGDSLSDCFIRLNNPSRQML